MKVTLALNPALLEAVAALFTIIQVRATEWPDDEDYKRALAGIKEGNAGACHYDHELQYVNYNQSMTLARGTVTLEGHRCALNSDDLADIMNASHEAVIVSYETSDKRLFWYETLDSYQNNRAPLPEVLINISKGGAIPDRFAEAVEMIINRPAKAMAQYSKDELAPARLIAGALRQRKHMDLCPWA